VIVVTGFASGPSRRQAIQAGATAYVAKPFALSTLTGVIETALAGATPPPAAPPPRCPPPTPAG
jgi:FixJ family two-component response regulator